MHKQRKPKKIILFIAIVATIFAAFTLTACGESEKENGNGYYDYGEGTKLADVGFPVTIPYVTDFTCDYYDSNGVEIEDKSIVFEPKDEIFVRVGFTLTADAYAAGKSKFTLKIAPSEEFDGRIHSANTSDTDGRELTFAFTADDKPKKCEIEAKIRFGYNSGRLRINYRYDSEEFAVATITPLNGSSPLVFIYDKETNGYIVKIYATNRWLQNVTEFVVPTDYKGTPVTGIGDQLFWGCESLKSVTLPSTLKTIGDEAFYGCKSIESITLPDSVTSIGEKVFSGCSSLRELILPDGIEDIGYDAFIGVFDRITYNKYENGSYLGSANNPYLCLIMFGYDVENPTIHEDCEVIGRYAFNPGKRLEGTLPALKSITLPSKVRVICDGAFYYCRSLETAELSDELISIGEQAFSVCDSLNSVTMGDKLKSIGYRGFFGCDSIESITLPDSLTDIGDYALPTIEKLYTVDKFNTGAELWYLGTKNNKYAFLMKSYCPYNVRIKDGCIAIAPRAFYGDFYGKYVETVVLPDSVKSIGSEAFSGCGKLTNIEMPAVKIIGDSAFSGCGKLESITIPDTVTSIGYKAFVGSGLKSVSLPSGITRIEESTFSSCESLETVVLPDTLTEIGSGAFDGCKSLKNISIPDSVVSIGDKAFCDCGVLTTANLPENLDRISYRMFESCYSLTSVTISGNVNSIDVGAFDFTHSFKEINFVGTRKAWLDILSFIPTTGIYVDGPHSFSTTVTAHCTDGDVVFEAYHEVLIYLSDPVFVKE